jgi:hypothetical protein
VLAQVPGLVWDWAMADICAWDGFWIGQWSSTDVRIGTGWMPALVQGGVSAGTGARVGARQAWRRAKGDCAWLG